LWLADSLFLAPTVIIIAAFLYTVV